MKIICDGCGAIVEKDKASDVELHYPFTWAIIQKNDRRYSLCGSCMDEVVVAVEKFIGGLNANSQKR